MDETEGSSDKGARDFLARAAGVCVWFGMSAVKAFCAWLVAVTLDSRRQAHKAKFLLNVFGVVVVLAYTTAAFLQWRVTHDILEGDMRPYVAAFSPTDLVAPTYCAAAPSATPTPRPPTLDFTIGAPLVMGVHLYNYGKLPAKATVRSLLTYSPTQRTNAGPFKLSKQESWLIWPNPTTLAEAARLRQDTYARSHTVKKEEIDQVAKGIGFVYLAVEVRYEEGYYRWHTPLHCVVSICQEWALSPRGVSPQGQNTVSFLLPHSSPCTDPASYGLSCE